MARKIAIVVIVLVIVSFGAYYILQWKNTSPDNEITENNKTVSTIAQMQVIFINKIPHDTAAFTEGLFIDKGMLYESTGEEGRSSLRKVELATGKVLKLKKLDDALFGEGIILLNNKIFMLTYKNKIALVYNAEDFTELKRLPLNLEGWGMTTDGKYLIISNGTNFIYYYDPETFTEVKKISVSKNNNLLSNINELEYIDGFIYANVYLTKEIIKIDAATGNVVAEVNLENQLRDQLPSNFDSNINTMNGIAYDAATKKMYITGKNWPLMFEVDIR